MYFSAKCNIIAVCGLISATHSTAIICYHLALPYQKYDINLDVATQEKGFLSTKHQRTIWNHANAIILLSI